MSTTHEHDPDERERRLCEAMGDLLEETLQPAAPASDAGSLGDLERALDDTAPPAPGKRRWLLGGSLAAGALAAALLVAYARRPLDYQVQGAVADGRGRLVAPAGETIGVRFSDGSSIALAPDSAGRI